MKPRRKLRMKPRRSLPRRISDARESEHIKSLEEFGVPHMKDTPNAGYAPVFTDENRARLAKNLKKASKKHGREEVRKEVSRVLRNFPETFGEPLLKRIEAMSKS